MILLGFVSYIFSFKHSQKIFKITLFRILPSSIALLVLFSIGIAIYRNSLEIKDIGSTIVYNVDYIVVRDGEFDIYRINEVGNHIEETYSYVNKENRENPEIRYVKDLNKSELYISPLYTKEELFLLGFKQTYRYILYIPEELKESVTYGYVLDF